jgi:acyl carrier protein
MTLDEASVRLTIRDYLMANFVLDTTLVFDDACSLLEAGILDSTGAMELVAFLENTFSIDVMEEDIVADNLDSIDQIFGFTVRKVEGRVGT